QLERKRIPVDMTFGVAACTRIAIPEPRSPDTVSRFQNLDAQTKPITNPDQLVEPREASTANQRVQHTGLIGYDGRGTRHYGTLSFRRSIKHKRWQSRFAMK